MKHIIIWSFIIILAACKCTKDTQQVNDESMPQLSIKQDSIKYFRNKGINYSVDEKLLPIYKQKLDSINKKNNLK